MAGDERAEVCAIGPGGVEREPEEVASAVLPVIDRAVGQRMLHAQRVEGATVEDATAAEAEVAQDVGVGVDDAVQRAVVEGGPLNRTLGVEGELGILGAAVGLLEAQRAGLHDGVGSAVAELIAGGVDLGALERPDRARDVAVFDQRDVGVERRLS